MAFKDNLTSLMNLFNLSNTDLSKAVHIDASVISRWKNGGRLIALNSPHLYSLARYFWRLKRDDYQKAFIDKILIISLSDLERENEALCIKALMDWLVAENNNRIDPMERAIFDKSPVAIAITREGRVLFANRTCLDMLGVSASGDIRGRQLNSLLVADGLEVEIETERIRLPDGPAQSNFIFDISDKRYLEKKYMHQLSVRQLLLDIAKAFTQSDIENIDDLINRTLMRIGVFDGSERCFVYQYSADLETISNTHEWCAEGIRPHRDMFQNVPVSTMAWWFHQNQTRDYLYIPDVASLPDEAASEQYYLSQRQVRSLLTVPVIQEGRSTGLLGVASFSAIRLWSDESIQMLEFVAQIIANSLTQKKYHDELKKSEKYYRLMFEAGEAKLIIDPDGTIVLCNDHFCRMTGYRPDQITGRHWTTLVPDCDWTDDVRREVRLASSQGKELVMQLSVTPMPDRRLSMATLIDQTEQYRLNRMLDAIRSCNQAILRAAGERDLMQSICDDLVQIGGYKLVWLGEIERDELQTLRILVRSGIHAEYTDRLDIALNNPHRGHGPAGQAIRQNKPVICRDLENSPDFLPWRQDAMQFGYRSVISIPFQRHDDGIRSVISIYSDKPDSFDEGEVELLQGLVSSMIYGINSITSATVLTDHAKSDKFNA